MSDNQKYKAPKNVDMDKHTRVISPDELAQIKTASKQYVTLAEHRANKAAQNAKNSASAPSDRRPKATENSNASSSTASVSAASATAAAVPTDTAKSLDSTTDKKVQGPRSARNHRHGGSSETSKKSLDNKNAAAPIASSGDKVSAPVEGSRRKRKKKHVWLKRILLALLCLMLIGILAACAIVYNIIKETPPIDPQTIYDNLEETTKMFDADGNELDTINLGFDRELADVSEMPENLKDAIIALEDKTFKTHHGFNIIRIFGAIKDALISGGQISGTSTITQQLARNIYLQETRFDRNYKRKIQEAYYALRIEKELSKDEIIGAYLNTINLGYGSYGVEAASQNYFGKHVSELTLPECAALAALPQLPSAYALIVFEEGGTAAAYPDTALKETADGVYVMNDASKDRRELCLDLMLEQELITQEEHDEAIAVPLKDMLNPDFKSSNSNAAYFADYCIEEVINDLINVKGMGEDQAVQAVYQGGLSIYSTLDSQAQEVIRTEFSNPYNYPWVEPTYDYNGNIIDENGTVTLYDYDNFFDSNGNFILGEDEYEFRDDGSLVIYYGNYLNIYTTQISEGTDYSLEFKNMFYYDEDYTFYTINGGFVNIPWTFKSINDENDLIISADFFNDPDYEGYFVKNEDGTLSITPKAYSLNPKSIQPQVAMTIIENGTGYIKAMVGGRNTSGRMIYNRAVSLRQPGSSIKPLGVYSAALQQSAEECYAGYTHDFVDYGIDKQGASLYGSYLTAASVVIDEKTTVDGKAWPKNFSNSYTGVQTMRSAMRESINTCAVKLWYQVGAAYSLQNVKNFGITSLVEEGEINDVNPSALALGGMTNGVNTLEMASAYTVFPNNGVRYEHHSYTKVLDRDGNVLLDNTEPEPIRVLDEGVAWIMADMLKDVVQSGTATNAYVPDTFVGGKTGTTSDEKDVWFDGFTTNYSASLWIGSDVAIDLSDNSTIATVLWGKIMRQIDGSYLGYRSEAPANVIYEHGEYFVSGTEKGHVPASSINKTVKLCKETGLLATPECTQTEDKKYTAYDSDYTPPKYYCYAHNSDLNAYPIDPADSDKRKAIEEEKARKEEEERIRQEEEERRRQEEEQKQQQQEQGEQGQEGGETGGETGGEGGETGGEGGETGGDGG